MLAPWATPREGEGYTFGCVTRDTNCKKPPLQTTSNSWQEWSEKYYFQVRREKRVWTCWLELIRTGSWETPRDLTEVLWYRQFTAWVEKTRKRKATKEKSYFGKLQKADEGWQVIGYRSWEPEPCPGRTSTCVSQLVVSPARALFETCLRPSTSVQLCSQPW